MLKEKVRETKFRAVVCLLEILLVVALSVFGCATKENIQPPSDQAGITGTQAVTPENKEITGINIDETADSIVVSITANHVLDYTLAEPPLQQAKVLYFPDAGLGLPQEEYPVDNEVLGTIQAVELVRGGPSKIVIPIKKPGTACEAHRGDTDNVLQVVFPRSGAGEYTKGNILAEDIIKEEEPAEQYKQPDIKPYQPMEEADVIQPDTPAVAATRLEKVDVLEEADRVSIKIKADGTIKTYKSFKLKNPPRIVFDMAGLASPYKKEQRLTVNSDIVKQVRHCGHPGYLRVVLDVNQDYLNDFKAVPVRDGLMIYVGNTEGVGSETSAPESKWDSAEEPIAEEPTEEPAETARVEVEEPQQEEVYLPSRSSSVSVEEEPPQTQIEDNDIVGNYDRPALVNSVDFIDDKGKSTIRIGTTHPVKFDLVKTGANKLRLTLKNADILSFRQRPLITTRFESAINSIIPLQTEAMKEKGLSEVDINLRQDVGYSTERKDNYIWVHFDASTVPPNPAAEDVVIPTGHELVAQGSETKTAGESMTTNEPATTPSITTEAVPEPESWAEGDKGSATSEASGSSEVAKPKVLGTREKVYTGEPIALEFYKTDIRNVIRILKDVSGKNFAIDEGVKGSVTLSFVNPVPWDQVLDLVLEMNNLGMSERGGIVRISTKKTIMAQKEAERAAMAAEQELKTTQEQLAPLVTEYFPISYANVSNDIMPHIQDILTPGRGHAKVDNRTNQLIMTDIQEKIDKAKEIIAEIDKVTPQVMINARIVQTDTNFSRQFGTEWGMANSPGTYRHEVGGTYNYDVAMNNPAVSTNSIGVNFSRIVGTPFSLDAKLSLMESEGEVRIISSPRVVTLDNKKAAISQGQEVPYLTASANGTNTQFKKAELKLEVTPHVTPDNRISMNIHIEQKAVGEQGALSQPPLDTKEANTDLLVNDGDTIVIGGIIQETEKQSQSGVPLISKIPILGHLFKQQSHSNDKSELLIFITPTIVRLD